MIPDRSSQLKGDNCRRLNRSRSRSKFFKHVIPSRELSTYARHKCNECQSLWLTSAFHIPVKAITDNVYVWQVFWLHLCSIHRAICAFFVDVNWVIWMVRSGTFWTRSVGPKFTSCHDAERFCWQPWNLSQTRHRDLLERLCCPWSG